MAKRKLVCAYTTSCELLDELSKENEQLKKELDSFKPLIFNDLIGKPVTLYEKKGDV